MEDDLYTYPLESPEAAPVQPPQEAGGGDFFGFFSVSLSSSDILYWMNVFALAWTIFYSALFMYDFFYYRIWHPDMAVSREKKGVRSANYAAEKWWTYAIFLFLYIISVTNTSLVGQVMRWVAMIFFFIKIVVLDLPEIPVIGSYFSNIADSLTSLAGNFWGNIITGFRSKSSK